MKKILNTDRFTQIALVVKDIDKSKAKIAEMFGVSEPVNIKGGDFAVTQLQYQGEPVPDANCTMAFFDLGYGMQLELIAPDGGPSVWQDFLEKKGEGLHHIAFNVNNMERIILSCEEAGMKLLQKGNYGDGSGCYSYLAGGEDLPLVIELLESF
jgi:catechol 2,3-dioxygenase-like lactoylglutathione lyase family enzyme